MMMLCLFGSGGVGCGGRLWFVVCGGRGRGEGEGGSEKRRVP